MEKKKRIVIALGGNALGNTLPEQMAAVKITARAIVDLIQEGCEVVVAHGNGPQVGMINNAMIALTHEDEKQPNTPLSVCVAMSQAYIGYDLQNALREELFNRGIHDIPVATMITQVRVDADDPAFETPSKPIGKFLSKEEADVMAETLRKSNIGKLSIGSKVNLERALKLEGRFGGHIVSGHIDGVGEIISLIKEDNAIWVTVKTSKDILKYIVMKGSIAIDGISLTVAYIDNEVFKVSIIPHTGGETTLLHKKNGETVNLECDVIGKYIEKFMRLKEESGQIKKQLLDETFLRENGFI